MPAASPHVLTTGTPSDTFKSVVLGGRRIGVRAYGFTVKDKMLPGVWFRSCSWFTAGSVRSAAAVVRHAGADQREAQQDRYVVLDGNISREVASGLRDRGWSLYPSVIMAVTQETFHARRVEDSVRRKIRRVVGGNAVIARGAWEIPSDVTDARLLRLTRDDVWFTFGRGAGTARVRVSLKGGVAWIDELVVEDACQGDGIGSALLDIAVTWAFRHGATRVELAADTYRWPRRWYAARGFTVTGSFTLAVRWS